MSEIEIKPVLEGDSPIMRMSASEHERNEEMASQIRAWLSLRSDRFTVCTTDRLFQYEISYSTPSAMLRINFAFLYDFDGHAEAPRDAATYVLKEFEAKLWKQSRGLFEADLGMCKRMFTFMLWKDDPKENNHEPH